MAATGQGSYPRSCIFMFKPMYPSNYVSNLRSNILKIKKGIHLIRQILIETHILFLNLSLEDLPILHSPYRPLKSWAQRLLQACPSSFLPDCCNPRPPDNNSHKWKCDLSWPEVICLVWTWQKTEKYMRTHKTPNHWKLKHWLSKQNSDGIPLAETE